MLFVISRDMEELGIVRDGMELKGSRRLPTKKQQPFMARTRATKAERGILFYFLFPRLRENHSCVTFLLLRVSFST